MKKDQQLDEGIVSDGKAVGTSAAGIVGLVLGAVALLTSFLPIINNVSFFFALFGAIFAIVGVVATVRKTRKGKGLAVAGLIICIVSAVVVLATQSLYSAAIDEAFDAVDSSAAASASSDASGEESAATEERETEGDKEEDGSSDYAVTIDGFELAEDYSGEAAIVVTYTFTNNSDESDAFDLAISDKCFQNGVQLETAYISDIDSENGYKEIKPGATVTVQQAYLLDDESDVTVECTELFSWDDEIIAEKTFSIA